MNKIKELLKEKGMSQKELAEKLGMTHFFIPFSNKSFTFEKGTPIMVAKGEEWEILPPDPYLLENSDFDYGGIKTYES